MTDLKVLHIRKEENAVNCGQSHEQHFEVRNQNTLLFIPMRMICTNIDSDAI